MSTGGDPLFAFCVIGNAAPAATFVQEHLAHKQIGVAHLQRQIGSQIPHQVVAQ